MFGLFLISSVFIVMGGIIDSTEDGTTCLKGCEYSEVGGQVTEAAQDFDINL